MAVCLLTKISNLHHLTPVQPSDPFAALYGARLLLEIENLLDRYPEGLTTCEVVTRLLMDAGIELQPTTSRPLRYRVLKALRILAAANRIQRREYKTRFNTTGLRNFSTHGPKT